MSLKMFLACVCGAYLLGYLTRPLALWSLEFMRRFLRVWADVRAEDFINAVTQDLEVEEPPHDANEGRADR